MLDVSSLFDRKQLKQFIGWMKRELGWLLGLLGAICLSLVPDSMHIKEPWHFWLQVIGTSSVAASAYMVRRFKVRGDNRDEPEV